ncbi:roquin-2 isoform X2 [Protopterus annectens]|uniref:roquin-2 isoform X2 n=1 Tax=Protopterus annectens TaxID=7888 RepID=UPI001CFB71FB|nr:roquin-2 isoform X2 [Protopterus annectens]
MPVQAAQWTEFLSCPICYNEFNENVHKPISLGCSHTVCKTCLNKLHRKQCPFDQTTINTDIDILPVNFALLQLVGAQVPDQQTVNLSNVGENKHYEVAKKCVEDLALYLKPLSGGKGVANLNQSALSRPMQRKLVTLVNCQLVEEEGRVRAMRAARSLGERTVTELILQHQNPQQLSANLWAAVRARGCQFLGPAMQEEALKLVLLALEDGSALSRKVLVLFVVQRLEPRFPQASKTSIGHVVQLLYRASCFKVTKRDEDSSLMQLKEEFRSYEALRREHDAQIVHIAMEAGLRISPEQWSSLLYGDLAHKSHMQSIIDKLQSPESFAKSVQELTIVLQRTGDPANLNRLRPHLELLANIDPNPDAAPPTWEQLENAMVAVKTVVHGLVDFIQNFSKKTHEAPQPQPNSKYKTSMCRDLRQQGGCPRGTNCKFAHSQDELENKVGSPPKTSISQVTSTSTSSPNIGVDVSPLQSKSGQFISRVSIYPPQHSENIQYFEDPRVSYEIPTCPQAGGYYQPLPAVPAGVTSCIPRYVRTNNVPESSLNSVSVPYNDHYSAYSPRERITSSNYPPPPPPPPSPQQYGSVPSVPSGMYAPVYDSRRIWRPHMYQRDDMIRSNSLPPMDVVHSSVYQNPLRERYNSLDSYCSVAGQSQNEQRTVPLPRDPCNRIQPDFDEPLRRKVDQWPHYHTSKPSFVSSTMSTATHSPTPPSPLFNVDFCEFPESASGLVGTKFKDDHLSHYSPWSCGTISSCISVVEADPKDVIANSSTKELESGDITRRINLFEPQRRPKDEDPIIPFGEGPIISKWGAISRSSRTGYHTTDPVQATASQGSTTKPISVTDYVPYISHADSRWSSYGSDSAVPSQSIERDRYLVREVESQRKHSSTGDLLSLELQNRDFSEDSTDAKPDRDIELELSVLDADEPDSQDKKLEEVLNRQLGIEDDDLPSGTVSVNGHQLKPHGQEPLKQEDRRLKQMGVSICEEQMMIPISSFLMQPVVTSGSISGCPAVNKSVNISSLVLKTAGLRISGDKEDFVKSAPNGKILLNSS